MIICNCQHPSRPWKSESLSLRTKPRHNIQSAKLCHPCCCDDDHQDYRQDYHGAQADMRFVKTNLEPQFPTQKGAICLLEEKKMWEMLCKTLIFQTLLKILTFVLRLHS